MAETRTEPPLMIQAQYTKDLSFENPNAPEVYAQTSNAPPDVTINIDVNPRLLEKGLYEVVLSFRVTAMAGEQTAFLIELDYAGVVSVNESVPEGEVEMFLLTEVPRHLFPFARGILADVTREGAFPPLIVNPIDFMQFYHHHKKAPAAGAETGEAVPGEAVAPDA